MKNFFVILLSLAMIFSLGCDSQKPANNETNKNNNEEEHGHHHHEAGAHGGNILDSGGTLHVEFVHDQDAGKVSLYILGGDGKTPQNISSAPRINLKTSDGPKQLKTQKVGDNASHYEVSDSALKSHLHGRIAIDFEGKRFNLDIETSHGDHAGHDDHVGHDDHDHGHGHDHPESAISHTQWTEKCEWFVELETPEVGKAAGFAAHVTLLQDFTPAKQGSFSAQATSGSQTASTSANSPARDGIYTPKITFPTAGKWNLKLTYKNGSVSDSIEYEIEVHEAGKVPHEEEEEGNAISFLKEQQWKIPFATVWSKENKVPASAVVKQNGKTFIYVQLDGESFEKREVKVSSQGDWVEISEGLQGKERVVSKGAAQIK